MQFFIDEDLQLTWLARPLTFPLWMLAGKAKRDFLFLFPLGASIDHRLLFIIRTFCFEGGVLLLL
jgi:hypothetical protein